MVTRINRNKMLHKIVNSNPDKSYQCIMPPKVNNSYRLKTETRSKEVPVRVKSYSKCFTEHSEHSPNRMPYIRLLCSLHKKPSHEPRLREQHSMPIECHSQRL